MSRRSSERIAAAFGISALLITFAAVAARPQEKATRPAEPTGTKKPADEIPPIFGPDEWPCQDATAIVDQMINEFDLKPHPLPSIPDDPPPHEGAMIDIPFVVAPTDLIIVEVLEALPGRPISGERLVRPDGKISLGFYGEISVSGLTLPQIKVAIIKRLRKFINDDILGLVAMDVDEPQQTPQKTKPQPPLELPDVKANPLDELDQGKTARPPAKPRASLGPPMLRRATSRTRSVARSIRRVRGQGESQAPDEKKQGEKNPHSVVIPMAGLANVKITIEVQGQGAGVLVPQVPEAVPPPAPEADMQVSFRALPLLENDRVIVDMTAYNSRNYYILGDVLLPGKLPWTGRETVLDALQYAGGLIQTAEPRDIRLVRPGRNGKPSRVYKVDLEAIQERGEVQTNYQLFPGDRLVVGRNEVVKKTVEFDRLYAPIHTVITSILNDGNMLKTLGALKPDQGDEVLKDLVDFWAKELSRKGDLKFDEQTLREILLRQLKKSPTTPQASPKQGAR